MAVASIEGVAGPNDPSGVPRDSSGVGSFGDLVAERVASRGSQVVLGLDPDPNRLWPAALDLAGAPAGPSQAHPGATAGATLGGDTSGRAGGATVVDDSPAARAARAVAAHCALVIEATAEQCVAVKPQVACFERLGAPGWKALADTVAVAHEHGLLVIADAKRGDVEVTAAAYAQAFLGETPTPYGPVPGLGVDAMTVNPLLGRDSLDPLITTARAHGRGLFVLVRTSNPGAADVQEQELGNGGAVSDHLADIVDAIGIAGTGASRLSDVGAVVGATAPGRLGALRERMPRAIFLLPGIGAQGGRVEELASAFAPGPAGGLVSSSRGIVAAYEQSGGDPAAAAAREAGRLRELAWRLTG
ncbi:MAG TPA: orotidine-5'-phosphate decarboxylase [Solirubrobacteraceae bacterium]